MPILYTAASRTHLAYILDPGGQESCKIVSTDQITAELRAIQYGLTEYFNKWERDLDARHFDFQQGEWAKVSSPADETKRELPWPVEVRLSDGKVYMLLQKAIPANKKQAGIRDNILTMLKNIGHRFVLTEINPARRLLN